MHNQIMHEETWRCGPEIPKARQNVKQALRSLFPAEHHALLIEELNAKLFALANSEEEYANLNTVDQRLGLSNYGDSKNIFQPGSVEVVPQNSGTLENHFRNNPFRAKHGVRCADEKYFRTLEENSRIENTMTAADLRKLSNYDLRQFSAGKWRFGYDYEDSSRVGK